MNVTVEGVPELRRKLEPARYDAVVKDVIDDLTRYTQLQAAGRAPRATGTLAASIHPESRELHGAVKVGAPYGRFVEFGTRRMRARPFLRPALEAARARADGLLHAAGEKMERIFR